MAIKPYLIKHLSNRKSENKYQLNVLQYIINDGTISYDYKYIDYFKSEAKALSYYKKHINEFKTKLTFEDAYISLISSKKISNGYLKNFKYSYNMVSSIHSKNIHEITLNDLTNILLSLDTYSKRKKVRLLFSQIYKYLISQGIDITDISKDINIPKISNKDIQYSNPFTIDEINKMCSDYYDDFVYDIIMFMIHTGIKTYTLFKIKIKDIDINNFRINTTNVSIQNQIILDDISREI